MHRQQATQTAPRRWSPRVPGPSGSGRPGRRPRLRGVPSVGARGRPAGSPRFLGGLRPGGGQSARRGKQPSGNSPVALARGLFGALRKKRASKPGKGSRRGPALLAVLGGLGAAGAAAFRRRQSTRNQPVPASAPDAKGATESPPAQSA
jgi:hypothetical protein